MALDVGHVASSDDPGARCGTALDTHAAMLLRADLAEHRRLAHGFGLNRN